jgi:hypothetical protein
MSIDEGLLRNSIRTSAAYTDAAADALYSVQHGEPIKWKVHPLSGDYFTMPRDGWYDGACQDPTIGTGGITTPEQLVDLLKKIAEYLNLLARQI